MSRQEESVHSPGSQSNGTDTATNIFLVNQRRTDTECQDPQTELALIQLRTQRTLVAVQANPSTTRNTYKCFVRCRGGFFHAH